MSKKKIEIMGLDSDFNIVTLLEYSNLQWRRKYYEPGTFSVVLPASQYSEDIKYIYSKDRPEVGEITQVNYYFKNEGPMFALSGYFLEKQLDRRIVYPNGIGNITNAPNWVSQSGAAEDVATAFFDAFKDVEYTVDNVQKESLLGIATSQSQGRGHYSEHERGEEYLGSKIYTILKPSEMSYRIVYDHINATTTFECWKGHDRTQDNEDDENPVVFSTAFGNLVNPNIVLSGSEYKNCYIVKHSYNENNADVVKLIANEERTANDTADRFIKVQASINKEDYATDADYLQAMMNSGHEELIKNKPTMSFDFDAMEGSYEYLTDFDLGDKCSLEVPEIQLSAEAILTGCNEVIKAGTWKLTMEFEV